MRVQNISSGAIKASMPIMTGRRTKKDKPFANNSNSKTNPNTIDLNYLNINYPIISSKPQHTPSVRYFDMDKLSKIETLERPEDKPLPFEKSHALFSLDKYQKEAIDSFTSGKTTIVSAPTGTGKTLIAEYAIKDSLNKGKKIIYLSPLKALSNEKYTDFAKLFGTYDEDGNLVNTGNVGLLTGDKSINPNAPVMVMTTEVYRNSLLVGDDKTVDIDYKDYDGVIYDEFHYLGDKDRGTVWEEAVMNTPSHMKQMMLSATASNASQIERWTKTINPNIETHLVDVPESERYVPLREFVLLNDNNGKLALKNVKKQKVDLYRIQNGINLSEKQLAALKEIQDIFQFKDLDETTGYLKSLSGKKGELYTAFLAEQLNKEIQDKDKSEAIALSLANKNSTVYQTDLEGVSIPERKIKTSQIIKILGDNNMQPALFYIFSKKGCNKEMEKASQNSESLLTLEESKMVYDEFKKAEKSGVFFGSDFDDLELEALMKGYAVHHAGKLPAYKSFVENLARKGLVKACFATETLIAGINMPFRTTLFTNLVKYDDDGETYISNSTFKQGAGRAGRRNKDILGNVIVVPHSVDDFDKYIELSKSSDTSIRSKYTPSYSSCLSDRTLNNVDDTVLKTLSAEQNTNSMNIIADNIEKRLDLLKTFGFVEQDENDTLKRTEKGEVAKKVFGVNEIFMTELLLEPRYLKDFTSTELIGICSCIADIKDENPSREFSGCLKYLNGSAELISGLADDISNFESYNGISDTPIKFSANLAPYIVSFADKIPDDREGAIKGWCDIMGTLRNKELICHDGDFLRVINSTIDILKLVAELSPDENIREEAKAAITKLKKPPVTDVINYELGNNELTTSKE